MADNIKTEVTARYELLSKTIADIVNRLKDCPEGGINIRRQNDRYYFYQTFAGDKEKYLSANDTDLITRLIQKNYLVRALKAAQNESAALERILDIYPDEDMEKVFVNLPYIRKKYVDPLFGRNDRYVHEWLSQPYVRKPFKKDDAVYLTLKGERVRSKSEVIIADRLFANGIPYKYECPLKVGKKVIHPDFTMLRLSDLKIIYHEHCGKMDDLDYVEERVVKRINDYSRAGIILGNNLFLTFESSATPLDVEVLDRVIKSNFM